MRCTRSRCSICADLRARARELAGHTDPDHTDPYIGADCRITINGTEHRATYPPTETASG